AHPLTGRRLLTCRPPPEGATRCCEPRPAPAGLRDGADPAPRCRAPGGTTAVLAAPLGPRPHQTVLLPGRLPLGRRGRALRIHGHVGRGREGQAPVAAGGDGGREGDLAGGAIGEELLGDRGAGEALRAAGEGEDRGE